MEWRCRRRLNAVGTAAERQKAQQIREWRLRGVFECIRHWMHSLLSFLEGRGSLSGVASDVLRFGSPRSSASCSSFGKRRTEMRFGFLCASSGFLENGRSNRTRSNAGGFFASVF